MDISDKDGSVLQDFSSGALKTLLSRVPGLGEIIGGYQAYNDAAFRRNVEKVIAFLQGKVKDLQSLFSDDWLKSEEGQKFTRKIVDSALDAQIEEKQELFVNALINGIRDKDLSDLQKLKFVDMLRHLSLAALDVLAEMDKIYEGRVHRPGKEADGPVPQIDSEKIVQQLSEHFDPYLIESAIIEMKAVGLFSPTIEWRKDGEGKFNRGLHYTKETVAYTDFTAKFVEFITMG